MISHPITRDRTRFSFSQKLWIPLFCSLLCVTGIFIFDAVQTRSLRIEERRNSLTQVDELALKTVAYYGGLAQGGKLTAEEAKQEAKAVIKGLRYGEDGYVAITDLDGVQVMNPMKPELDGKNRNDFQDAHGTYVFRDNAAIGRTESGVGFTSYVWPRPGETEAVPKMSRVVTYKPWGWTLVTGVYMDDIDAVFRKTLWLKGGVLLGVGALLALVMAYVNRSLGGTLGGAPEYATEVAARIAANDLSSAVAIEKDDRGSLLSAMKTMQANLAATIQGIRQSADAIATASQQVAAGNTDLSSRTEEQASALEETASSMEELNVTVRHNAENAQEANKLAASAYQSALDSNEVVSRLVDTMHLIDAKSNKIGDVIGIIDGIAFQTNILALNAAVEAARAGEQGRGFAVVAAEVRNLAKRSSDAAREVKALVADSSSAVQAGVQLTEQAGRSMGAIMTGAKNVTQIVGDISTASREQASGIEQVAIAISQMDQVTQKNAALVEESAAAAALMQQQADHLLSMVSVFQVSEQAVPAG